MLASNPSSGALHPTEAYILLPQDLSADASPPAQEEGAEAAAAVAARAGMYHYHPFEHALERRSLLPAPSPGLAWCASDIGPSSPGDTSMPLRRQTTADTEISADTEGQGEVLPDSCVDAREDCAGLQQFCFDGRRPARFSDIDCCRSCWPQRAQTAPPPPEHTGKASMGTGAFEDNP